MRKYTVNCYYEGEIVKRFRCFAENEETAIMKAEVALGLNYPDLKVDEIEAFSMSFAIGQ